MEASQHKRLVEELTKADISKEVKVYLDSAAFKDKIEKIVRDRIKNDKTLEDKVVDISKNVLTQLFKALWTKRGMWRSNLSNKTS
jgi:hypothetical protein